MIEILGVVFWAGAEWNIKLNAAMAIRRHIDLLPGDMLIESLLSVHSQTPSHLFQVRVGTLVSE